MVRRPRAGPQSLCRWARGSRATAPSAAPPLALSGVHRVRRQAGSPPPQRGRVARSSPAPLKRSMTAALSLPDRVGDAFHRVRESTASLFGGRGVDGAPDGATQAMSVAPGARGAGAAGTGPDARRLRGCRNRRQVGDAVPGWRRGGHCLLGGGRDSRQSPQFEGRGVRDRHPGFLGRRSRISRNAVPRIGRYLPHSRSHRSPMRPRKVVSPVGPRRRRRRSRPSRSLRSPPPRRRPRRSSASHQRRRALARPPAFRPAVGERPSRSWTVKGRRTRSLAAAAAVLLAAGLAPPVAGASHGTYTVVECDPLNRDNADAILEDASPYAARSFCGDPQNGYAIKIDNTGHAQHGGFGRVRWTTGSAVLSIVAVDVRAKLRRDNGHAARLWIGDEKLREPGCWRRDWGRGRPRPSSDTAGVRLAEDRASSSRACPASGLPGVVARRPPRPGYETSTWRWREPFGPAIYDPRRHHAPPALATPALKICEHKPAMPVGAYPGLSSLSTARNSTMARARATPFPALPSQFVCSRAEARSWRAAMSVPLRRRSTMASTPCPPARSISQATEPVASARFESTTPHRRSSSPLFRTQMIRS